jgi:hypothetical protein
MQASGISICRVSLPVLLLVDGLDQRPLNLMLTIKQFTLHKILSRLRYLSASTCHRGRGIADGVVDQGSFRRERPMGSRGFLVVHVEEIM